MDNLPKTKQILLSPVITYKSTEASAKKCYTFVVACDANKHQIALAFEKTFGVKVLKVNTTAIRTKKRRTKFGISQKSDGKKAYIWAEKQIEGIFPQL